MPEPARPAVQLPQVFSMHCWSIPSNVCLNEASYHRVPCLSYPCIMVLWESSDDDDVLMVVFPGAYAGRHPVGADGGIRARTRQRGGRRQGYLQEQEGGEYTTTIVVLLLLLLLSSH